MMHTLTDQDHRLLGPLTRFYVEADRTLPVIERVTEQEIPQPQCGLLSQTGDMTPALEHFYNGQLQLQLLGQHLGEAIYSRQVALSIIGKDAPVGFGAIDIDLAVLGPPVRDKILEASRPLGGILLAEGVDHRSQPQCFFRVCSDAMMIQTFRLADSRLLYGRCNRLVDARQRTIADVVEILCPDKRR